MSLPLLDTMGQLSDANLSGLNSKMFAEEFNTNIAKHSNYQEDIGHLEGKGITINNSQELHLFSISVGYDTVNSRYVAPPFSIKFNAIAYIKNNPPVSINMTYIFGGKTAADFNNLAQSDWNFFGNEIYNNMPNEKAAYIHLKNDRNLFLNVVFSISGRNSNHFPFTLDYSADITGYTTDFILKGVVETSSSTLTYGDIGSYNKPIYMGAYGYVECDEPNTLIVNQLPASPSPSKIYFLKG